MLGLDWLHEKLAVSSEGEGRNGSFGGGDLTQVGLPVAVACRIDCRFGEAIGIILQVSVGGCTSVVALAVGELVGFWIIFQLEPPKVSDFKDGKEKDRSQSFGG